MGAGSCFSICAMNEYNGGGRHFASGGLAMSNRKAPPVRHDDPGMTGQRARDLTGELRQKRGDTLIRTVEEPRGSPKTGQ